MRARRQVKGKVALIEPRSPGFHIFSLNKLPRLGLPLLGALLKGRGYSVRIFCEELAPLDWSWVLSADLVGISVITPTAPRAYELIRQIKARAPGIPIVLGGPQVTFLPEEALEAGADYVVRREGEETLVELAEALKEGEREPSAILGLSYRSGDEIKHNQGRPLIEDLDRLPFPDLSLIAGAERINVLPIQTSRGCPYNCKFCSVVKMFGRKYRARSVEGVLEELRLLHRRSPRAHVFFYDDNFSEDTARTKRLLEAMLREGLTPPWSAQERVKVVRDTELLELMKRSGCVRLCLGLESINPETLKSYRKAQTVEEIDRAIKVLHRYGIKVHGMFVLGADTDTLATIRETLRYSLAMQIDTVQFLILTPVPGTETYQELEAEGRIFTHRWELFDGHHVVFRPKLLSPWQLQAAVTLEAMPRFYSFWRGIGAALKGEFRNSFFVFYGHRLLKRWKALNIDFLRWLQGQGWEVAAESRSPLQ